MPQGVNISGKKSQDISQTITKKATDKVIGLTSEKCFEQKFYESIKRRHIVILLLIGNEMLLIDDLHIL